MANLKYSYDNTDVPTGGGGEDAPVGVMMDGEIVSCTHRTQKSDGSPTSDIEIVVDVGSQYKRMWRYINFETNQRWKMREFTDAVGLPPKGSLTDAILKKQEGKKVKVKTGADKDLDGNPKTIIKNLFSPSGTSEEDPASVAGDGNPGDPAYYAEWTDDDLKAEAKEKEITIPGRWSRDKAIEALVEFAGPGAGDAGDDASTNGGGDISSVEGYEDFANWSDDDLKTELSERNLTISGRFSSEKARAAIVEAVLAGGNGDAGTGEAPTDDYDDKNDEGGPLWNDQELKDEIKARNESGAEIKVAGRWTREKAIDALRADNQLAAKEPF